MPSSLHTTQQDNESSSKFNINAQLSNTNGQQESKMVSFVAGFERDTSVGVQEKIVEPFTVRKIKKNGFEFYPQRSKLFFEAKRSVNNPSEARRI